MWLHSRVLAVSLIAGTLMFHVPPTARAGNPAPPLPDSMAALGDSTTQASNDCCSPGNHPEDSWSTGNSAAHRIDSHYLRIVSANRKMRGHEHNDAVPGSKVADTNSQAEQAVAQRAEYVSILIGSGDLCTPTISGMTPTAIFRQEFETTMTTLEQGMPMGAHIYISSILNIYTLWQILHTDPTAEDNWNDEGTCQSMLNPSNTEAQRQQVLLHEEADNSVLQSVCQRYSNCLWDNLAAFNYPVLPNEVSLLDYFHPSAGGQATLADVSWKVSWWPDVR